MSTTPQSRVTAAEEKADAPPSVLYVGGYGRSGSTVLGRILGEAEDAICVGEARYLWSRGLLHNVECGCGARFRDCPFWTAVGEQAFGGWERIDTELLVEMDRAIILLRTLPFHWAPRLRPRFGAAIGAYVSWLSALYPAIARVAGVTTVVDTSKDPNFASLLTRMRGVDVRIVHLVRDSRAVAYSWTRSKRMPGAIGGEEFMPRFPAADTAARWVVWNLAFHALAARRSPYMLLNYENFVADPEATLRRLGDFAGKPLLPAAAGLDGNRVRLGEHHIFSGNPMRSRTGWLEIRRDDEWKAAQLRRDFAKVTAISLPLLRLYRYPTVPRRNR
jgi:hypothetical protein